MCGMEVVTNVPSSVLAIPPVHGLMTTVVDDQRDLRNKFSWVNLWGQSLYLPQEKPSDRRNKVQQECKILKTLALEI